MLFSFGENNINELIPLIIATGSVIIASYSLYKTLKMPEIIEEHANKTLNTLDEILEETFKPINEKISKSYSHLGSKGALVKQEKALDKRLAQDMINLQDPLIQGALEMFPNVKEYVDKNPHLLIKLLPRIQALQQVEGFSPLDIISPSSPQTPTPSDSIRRVHSEQG